MGVRFQCPHGHKLHVKAELAGKRGICPECGAKFIVPAFNSGRVAWDAGAGDPPPSKGGARGGTKDASPSSAAHPSQQAIPTDPGDSLSIQTQPPPVAASPPAVEPPTPEPLAWYVRPAAGGQFGPASTEVFRTWVEDGRVAADSWVWRTGWSDWKAGAEALTQIPAAPAPPQLPLPVPVQASTPKPSASVDPPIVNAAPAVTEEALIGAAAHIEPASADVRRAEIKRRKDNVRRVSTVLALVALAMLMALVVVLAR